MIQSPDWYFALVIFIALLGFLVAGILFFVNKSNPFSSRLLGWFLVCISIVAVNNELMATSFYLRFPHLWRVVVGASFCVPVFSYLYVSSVLEQSYRIRPVFLFLFLPAILYTLSLVPFYLLPAAKKLEIISRVITNNSLIAREPEGILPSGWGIYARLIFGLSIVLFQFRLITKWKKNIITDHARLDQNLAIYRWLLLFTTVLGSLYIAIIIITAFQLTTFISIWQMTVSSLSATILFISIYLLVKPNILYGVSGWHTGYNQQEQFIKHENQPAPAGKKVTLSPDQQNLYRQLIENHFEKVKPFLKPGYKILELSEELGIPSYQVSIFINHEYSKNFNELVNDFRINYLSELLKENPGEFSQYTLEALGRRAGFNSRNSFIAAVKKKSGKTPSEFFDIKEVPTA